MRAAAHPLWRTNNWVTYPDDSGVPRSLKARQDGHNQGGHHITVHLRRHTTDPTQAQPLTY